MCSCLAQSRQEVRVLIYPDNPASLAETNVMCTLLSAWAVVTACGIMIAEEVAILF